MCAGLLHAWASLKCSGLLPLDFVQVQFEDKGEVGCDSQAPGDVAGTAVRAVCGPMSLQRECSGSDVPQLHQLTLQVGALAQSAALGNVAVMLKVFTNPFGLVLEVQPSGIS